MSGKERCGSLATGFKLTCDLPPGHVKTEADWHEGRAETKQTTAQYEWSTTEVVRWAPMSWEIPKPLEAPGEPLETAASAPQGTTGMCQRLRGEPPCFNGEDPHPRMPSCRPAEGGMEVKRLVLQPGDRLVIRYPFHLPQADREAIARDARRDLGLDGEVPPVPILVLGGPELTVLGVGPEEKPPNGH